MEWMSIDDENMEKYVTQQVRPGILNPQEQESPYPRRTHHDVSLRYYQFPCQYQLP
jgi:hypothetical protein